MIFTYEQISKLNDTELIVYNYIVKNVGLVLKMNIRELAAQSHVSTATITRFCHKLDCDGFVEFKIELMNTFVKYIQSFSVNINITRKTFL